VEETVRNILARFSFKITAQAMPGLPGCHGVSVPGAGGFSHPSPVGGK